MNKEKRKEQIVRAALSIFAYNGFRETKMAEIAEKAGIGKGTIYEYFKSKEEIFHEAFNLFQQEIDSEVSKRLFGLVDPKEKLIVLINTFFELYLNFADDARIMLHFWSEGIRHEKSKRKHLVLKVNHIYDRYRNYITSFLDEGVYAGIFRPMNSIMVASTIIGAMDGLIIQWIIDKKHFSLREAGKELADIIFNGIEYREKF